MEFSDVGFFKSTPFTFRDYQRFGVEVLKKRGVKVWFLDLTDVFNPHYDRNDHEQNFAGIETRKISTFQEWEMFVQDIRSRKFFVVVIDLLTIRNWKAIEKMNQFNIPFALLQSNTIPIASDRFSYSIFSKAFWNKVVNFLKKIFFARRLSCIKVPVIFAGGSKSIKQENVSEGTRIIWGHTLDYDIYLDYLRSKHLPLVEGKYIVFLDEAGPYHPDFFLSGIPSFPYKIPEDYYNEMDQMFTSLEKKYGCPVVIAAHPKASYAAMPNVYKGRKIISAKTINLVAHADCVLAHSSTSILFAVLFEKPVVFLQPEKYKRTFYGDFVTVFSRELNQQPMDLAGLTRLELFQIDKKAYRSYQEQFIKKQDSPKQCFWEIMWDSVGEWSSLKRNFSRL